jgi:hypothetical protein
MPVTMTVAQNQRNILRKRLRTVGFLSPRICLRPRHEEVAAASHRLDSFAALRGPQLPAHVADVDIDDSIEGAELPAEDAFGELLAGEDSSGGAQEGFQQRELHAGQIQPCVVQPDFTRYRIEAEIAYNQRDRRGCKLGGPAQNRTDSRKELAWIEWLRQVVVRSDLESQDSLDIFSTRGQDQHRNGRLRAQPAENVQTAHARQHKIEDDKGVFSGESAFKPTRSVVHGFDREPLGAKALGEKSAQLDIIIDDENTIHSLPPATSDSILDHPSTVKSTFTKLYLA